MSPTVVRHKHLSAWYEPISGIFFVEHSIESTTCGYKNLEAFSNFSHQKKTMLINDPVSWLPVMPEPESRPSDTSNSSSSHGPVASQSPNCTCAAALHLKLHQHIWKRTHVLLFGWQLYHQTRVQWRWMNPALPGRFRSAVFTLGCRAKSFDSFLLWLRTIDLWVKEVSVKLIEQSQSTALLLPCVALTSPSIWSLCCKWHLVCWLFRNNLTTTASKWEKYTTRRTMKELLILHNRPWLVCEHN